MGNEAAYQILQTGGLKNNWKPGVTVNYRTTVQNPRQFRYKIFIPPATNVKVMCAVGQSQGALYQFAARMGQAPSESMPCGNLTGAGFTIDQLRKSDGFGQNSSGYLRIVSSGGNSRPGDWLYVCLRNSGGTIMNIQVTVSVDPAAYRTWYNSVVWDAYGNPVVGAAPIPVPGPTSVDVVVTKEQYTLIQNGATINWRIK
jgi:hypothetical protein